MSDELFIDATGTPQVASQALRDRLAALAGSWRLLEAGPDLLVALRKGASLVDDLLPQAELAQPALAGDLGAIPPSDLLSLLNQGRRSGILLASCRGVERCAVLIDGQVTWVASSSPVERLTVEKASPQTPTEDLWRLLDEKAIDVVFGLLAAEEGTFAFLSVPPDVKLPAVFAIDTQAVLLDGLRRIDEMRLYRTRVPAGARPVRVSDAPAEGAEITDQMLRLIELADGQRTVSDLAVAVGLGELAATRACYHLVISGLLLADAPEPAGRAAAS
jgi:hypothetical protein